MKGNNMSKTKGNWKIQAVELAKAGALSWRAISKVLGVPKSSVSDYLRKNEGIQNDAVVEEKVEAGLGSVVGGDFKGDEMNINKSFNVSVGMGVKGFAEVKPRGKTHLFIPDSQVKEGVPLEFLTWIGKYIARKQPDVIVHAGDFSDMESCSSYDKGKKSAEGKRIQIDIDVTIKAMAMLLKPMRELQAAQRAAGEKVYEPRMVLTLGNHCHRITRHVDSNAELEGLLSIDSLQYKEFGWEVIPYLTPINIDGIHYCHFFPNVMNGKPLGGTAASMLKTIGTSFTQGHKQTLDVATRFLPTTGQQQWGLVAGACYQHEEDYKGVQGNKHWRGIVCKHNVSEGSYDPLFISLDWLEKQYGA